MATAGPLEEYYWLLLSNDFGLPVLNVYQNLSFPLATQGLVSKLRSTASLLGISVSQVSAGADDEHRLTYSHVAGGLCSVFTNVAQSPMGAAPALRQLAERRGVRPAPLLRGPQVSASAEIIALCNHLIACGLGTTDWATLMRNPNNRVQRAKLSPLSKAIDAILRTAQGSLQHAPVTLHARCVPADPLPLQVLLAQVAAEVGATHAAIAIGRVVVTASPSWWQLPPRTASVIVAAAQAAGGRAETRTPGGAPLGGGGGAEGAPVEHQRLRRSSTLALVGNRVGGAGGGPGGGGPGGGAAASSGGRVGPQVTPPALQAAPPARGVAAAPRSVPASQVSRPQLASPGSAGVARKKSVSVMGHAVGGAAARPPAPQAAVTALAVPSASASVPGLALPPQLSIPSPAAAAGDGLQSYGSGLPSPNALSPVSSAVALHITAPPALADAEDAIGIDDDDAGQSGGVPLVLQRSGDEAEELLEGAAGAADAAGGGVRVRRKRLSRLAGSSVQLVPQRSGVGGPGEVSAIEAAAATLTDETQETVAAAEMDRSPEHVPAASGRRGGASHGAATLASRPCTAVSWTVHLPLGGGSAAQDTQAVRSRTPRARLLGDGGPGGESSLQQEPGSCFWHGDGGGDEGGVPPTPLAARGAAATDSPLRPPADRALCVPAIAVAVPLSLLPTLSEGAAGEGGSSARDAPASASGSSARGRGGGRTAGLGVAVATMRSHVQLILVRPLPPPADASGGGAPALERRSSSASSVGVAEAFTAANCAAAVSSAIAGFAGLAMSTTSAQPPAVAVRVAGEDEPQFSADACEGGGAAGASPRLLRLLTAMAQAECAAVRCHTAHDWALVTDSRLAHTHAAAAPPHAIAAAAAAAVGESGLLDRPAPVAAPAPPVALQIPYDGWAHALLDAAQDGVLSVGLVASTPASEAAASPRSSALLDSAPGLLRGGLGSPPLLRHIPTADTDMSVYTVRSGADPFLLRLRFGAPLRGGPFRLPPHGAPGASASAGLLALPGVSEALTARSDSTAATPAMPFASRAAASLVPLPAPPLTPSAATAAVARLLSPLDLGPLADDLAALVLPQLEGLGAAGGGGGGGSKGGGASPSHAPLLRWSVPAAALVALPTCRCAPAAAARPGNGSVSPAHADEGSEGLLSDRSSFLRSCAAGVCWPGTGGGAAASLASPPASLWWIVGNGHAANALSITSEAAAAAAATMASQSVRGGGVGASDEPDSNELSPERRRVTRSGSTTASLPPTAAAQQKSSPGGPWSRDSGASQGSPSRAGSAAGGSSGGGGSSGQHAELGRAAVHAAVAELLSDVRTCSAPPAQSAAASAPGGDHSSALWSLLYFDSALASLLQLPPPGTTLAGSGGDSGAAAAPAAASVAPGKGGGGVGAASSAGSRRPEAGAGSGGGGSKAASTVACWQLAWRLHAVLLSLQALQRQGAAVAGGAAEPAAAASPYGAPPPRWLRLATVLVRASSPLRPTPPSSGSPSSSSSPPSRLLHQLCCSVDLHVDLHALAARLAHADAAAAEDAQGAIPSSPGAAAAVGRAGGHARTPSVSSVASGSGGGAAVPFSSSDAALRMSRLLPDVLPPWVLGAAAAGAGRVGSAPGPDAASQAAAQSIPTAAAALVAAVLRELQGVT